jgi:plasmid replication initiation protein
LLNDIVQLNSKYSIALYKLIRLEHGKHGSKPSIDKYQTLVASIEEWRDIFEAPEAYSTSIFMRNCVKRAINEINLKIDDLRIDKPGYKKNGHRIVEMRLNVVNGIGEL